MAIDSVGAETLLRQQRTLPRQQQQIHQHHAMTFHSPRDPGGVNTMGEESVMGEDPPIEDDLESDFHTLNYGGSPGPGVVVEGVPPATPTRRQGVAPPPGSINPSLMALLVGLPPPPPPTPPPPPKHHKKRSASVSSKDTQRVSNNKSSTVPQPKPPSPPSPDEEALNRARAFNSHDRQEIVHRKNSTYRMMDPPDSDYENIEHHHRKARNASMVGLNTNEPTPTKGGQENESPGGGVYHDDSLAPTPNNNPAIVAAAGSAFSYPSPQQALRSPLSISTEPTSNNHRGQGNHMPLTINNGVAGSSSTTVATEDTDFTKMQRQREQQAPIRRFRPKTPDRLKNFRPRTPDRLRQLLVNGQHRLRNGDQSSTEGMSHRRPVPVEMRPSRKPPQQNNTRRVWNSSPENISMSMSERSNGDGDHIGSPSFVKKGSNKKGGFLRKIFGGGKKRGDSSRSLPQRGSMDATTVTSDHGRSVYNEDHHMTANHSSPSFQMDSNGDEDDNGAVFFGHDDVSTLTGPTMESIRLRKDPTEENEKVSEPLGRYFNSAMGITTGDSSGNGPSIDPFTAPFFQEPQGVSPMPVVNTLPEKALMVEVPPMHDPLGESPLNSQKNLPIPGLSQPLHDPSPQGFQKDSGFREVSTQDPIGESPLHKHERGPSALVDGTPVAADPPLFIAEMDDVSSDDSLELNPRKKLDVIERASPSTVPRRKVMLPPPSPPSPSPRNQMRKNQKNSALEKQNMLSKQTELHHTAIHSAVLPPSQVIQSAPDVVSSAQAGRTEETDLTLEATAMSEPVEERFESRFLAKARAANPTFPSKRTIAEDKEPQRLPESKFMSKARASQNVTFEKPGGSEERNSSKQKSKKVLSMSTAAKTNAKTMAYLHTLYGEPSPRHVWRQPDLSDDDASPMMKYLANSKSAFFQGQPSPSQSDTPDSRNGYSKSARFADSDTGAVDVDAMYLFSAYSGKFKGRKPNKKQQTATKPAKSSLVSKARVRVAPKPKKELVPVWKQPNRMGRNIDISSDAVHVGYSIRRSNRELAISNGNAKRVVPVKKTKVPKVESYFGPFDNREPKDPIQRAGRRLLAKAAVKIQAEARRYLAQKEAVDRMWALLEIQSYCRRWRAECSMIASKTAASDIQRIYRGSRCRMLYVEKQSAAIEIQRMIRGYLSAVFVYEQVYQIILLQARARGNGVRHMLTHLNTEATRIQSAYRSFLARSYKQTTIASVTMIQALWRAYQIRTCYQFVVVDLIIAQSAVRRWIARCRVQERRLQLQSRAAKTIQARWRGFQAYTDYIFTLVDVLIVQRTARKWFANQRAKRKKSEDAAILIQKHWRRRNAQLNLYIDLMHVIMVQSFARRFLARSIVRSRQSDKLTEDAAAVKIQALWRGFWQFSHFVIQQFEATQIQAAIRGKLARQKFIMKLGCCILIQSAVRVYLSKSKAITGKVDRALAMGEAQRLRENNACKRIQFFWRVVLDCRKEKAAALVIEKFFINVMAEVDKEIQRALAKENTRSSKRGRRQKKKQSDDDTLEQVWLDTVDENHVDVFTLSQSKSLGSSSHHTPRSRSSYESFSPRTNRSGRSKRSDSVHSGVVRHRASSPTMNLVMRHEYEPSVVTRSSRHTKKSAGDLSLDETFEELEGADSTERFFNKILVHTAPSSSSSKHSFFSDDGTNSSQRSRRKSWIPPPASSRSDTSRSLHNASDSFSYRESASARHYQQSPHHERKTSPVNSAKKSTSPRHSKIRVMNAYPEFRGKPRVEDKEMVESEYVGEEFGLI